MASKKKKYNARFPAGRIKRIMQTDEEVGKVAKAVPVIISRTLELFVESLLKKSMSVTLSRNAKTLSPSHVKQCIMAESRFDFLKDLVKNIPDVSAAEEKELQSAENSPTAMRFPEDKCETQPPAQIESILNNTTSKLYAKRPVSEVHSEPIVPMKQTKIETVTCAAIDLSIRPEPQRRVPNFYQETLNMDDSPTVIQANPNFSTPQPSTSFKMIPHLKRIDPLKIPAFQSAMTGKTTEPLKSHRPDLTITPPCLNRLGNNYPKAPITPVLNIDFTKNIESPEFKYSMPKKKEVKRTNLEKSASFESYTSTSKNLSKKPISKTPQLISRPQLDRMAAISSLDEDYDT